MLDSAATWNKETTQFMPLKRCSLLETNKHTWNWEPNRSMLSETKLQSVGGKVDESRHVLSQILRQHHRKGEDLLPKRCISNVEPLCPFITMAVLIIFPHYFPTWSHRLPNMQMIGLSWPHFQWSLPGFLISTCSRSVTPVSSENS